MGKFKLTADQEKILQDDSRNLLVSASAGSGKTATVIEKIFELIKIKKVDVYELLVITFTEAASNEMKARLKAKLYEEASSNFELKNQIDKLPTSDISTIHSMCSKMLRKYFYALDINPNFLVLDENNSKFLKSKALDKVVGQYSKNEDNTFVKLTSLFGRNFDKLKINILSYYDFLSSLENKEDYRQKTLLKGYNLNLEENVCCKYLNEYLLSSFYYYQKRFEKLLQRAREQKAIYFEEFLSEILIKIKEIKFENSFVQNHNILFALVFPSLTRKKLDINDENFKEEVKVCLTEFKKQFESLKNLFDEEKIENIIGNLSYAKSLIVKFDEVEREFEKVYKALKKQKNALDFEDLESEFLKLLDIDKIGDDIAKKYKYIFVDEYQDINNVQELILSKLSRKAKIVMVGDIKQSIYGFRNSTPNIFIEKAKLFDGGCGQGKLVNLNDNFRSNPRILNFVNAIFSKIMTRDFGGVDYDKDSKLNGKTEYLEVSNIPTVKMLLIDTSTEENSDEENFDEVYSVLGDKNKYEKLMSTERREGILVAENIAKLIGKDIFDAKEKKIKKISFSDIAILGRSNEFLKNIANVLTEFKIPVSIKANDAIYDNIDVDMLLSMLKIVNSTHDDIALCTSLTSIFGGLNFDDLAKIRKEFFDKKYFYECVDCYLDDGKDTNLKSKLEKFFELIKELRFKMLTTCNIFELFSFLQDRFDFLSYFESLPNGSNRVEVVKDFVQSFANSSYNNDLVKYLDFVEKFAKNSKFENFQNSSNNCVHIGTIHSSKGLEYPIVFLVGLNKPFSAATFKSEILKDLDFGIGFSTFDLDSFVKEDNVAKNAISLHLKRKERAEELRLLYVALTRAKNHLILLGHVNLKSVNRVSNFVDAENASSYMPLVLAGINDTDFKNLIFSQKGFVSKNKDFEVEIEVVGQNDFVEKKVSNREKNFFTNTNFDNSEIKKRLNYKYEVVPNIALKNTVSSILKEFVEDSENFNDEPKTMNIFENSSFNKVDAGKLGTVYHKFMQNIDFLNINCLDNEYLLEILDNIDIEEEYKKKIDLESVKIAIKNIASLKIKRTLKEQQFLSYLPYNSVFKNGSKDKILIQGVADLLVETRDGKFILIDYKTNKVSKPDQLVEKYTMQLKLYKICLEKALNILIDDCYIYSFCLKTFIKIF